MSAMMEWQKIHKQSIEIAIQAIRFVIFSVHFTSVAHRSTDSSGALVRGPRDFKFLVEFGMTDPQRAGPSTDSPVERFPGSFQE
jgi:hypothetical protein